jgi:hypothetical protein
MKCLNLQRVLVSAFVVLFVPGLALGQFGDDWVVFVDPLTGEECGIVNTSNAELTVVDATGEMILVSGVDTLLPLLFVDLDNNVFFDGQPAGTIVYADDADGFASVFWVTDLDTVVEIDLVTGEPFDSGLFPEEISGNGCFACDFIDDDPFCGGEFPIDFPPISCGTGSAVPLMAGGLLMPFVGGMVRRRRRF